MTQAMPVLGKFFVTLLKFAKIEQCAKYQVSVVVFSCVIHHYSVQLVLNAKMPIAHVLYHVTSK